jgi:hypothetical protein
MRISEKTAIISLYNINWMVCITETECVYCAVRTGSLNVTYFERASFACFPPRSKIAFYYSTHHHWYTKGDIENCESSITLQGLRLFSFSHISNLLLCRQMWLWHWKERLYKIFRYFDEPALVKNGEKGCEVKRLSKDGKGSSKVGSHKVFLEILVALCNSEETVSSIIWTSL